MSEISVKEHPELRHVLAHLYYAIEALSSGHSGEALYELRSIEGLVFWDTDERMTEFSRRFYREKLQGQRKEKLQGQKEIRKKTRPSKRGSG